MKYLIITALILFSCSPDWHIRRAQFKQPNILDTLNDTIKLIDVRLDTIYYNDTFQVVQTVTKRDTVIKTKYLAPETRYETRWKHKTIIDTVMIKEKQATKQNKHDNKAEVKKNRGYWYWWLVFGIVVGAVLMLWICSVIGNIKSKIGW